MKTRYKQFFTLFFPQDPHSSFTIFPYSSMFVFPWDTTPPPAACTYKGEFLAGFLVAWWAAILAFPPPSPLLPLSLPLFLWTAHGLISDLTKKTILTALIQNIHGLKLISWISGEFSDLQKPILTALIQNIHGHRLISLISGEIEIIVRAGSVFWPVVGRLAFYLWSQRFYIFIH